MITREAVNEMKRLAVLANRLSDWHVNNLKMFVQVAFDNVDSASIDYQMPIIDETNGWVKYDIHIKRAKKGSSSSLKRSRVQRGKDLATWTKDLLWRDMDVSIFINGKELSLERKREKRPSTSKSDKSS